MKFFNIALLFVIIALVCQISLSAAEDTKRPGLRRPLGKGGKASSTTTSAPAEDEEGDYTENGEENQYGEEGEEGDASSTTTTTTEAPKRIGPVIRPFRSNDDFLNSLKRRQMNAKKNKAEKPAPKAKAPAAEADGEEEESAPAPSPAAKGFSKPNPALNRRKLNKPSKPEPAEDTGDDADGEHKEEAAPKRPIGRLALRKRN